MTRDTERLQRPIGSGFDDRTTSDQVMEGVDLQGKAVVVTGGYSGLGLETTRHLVATGADVIVLARRPAEADAALRELPQNVSVVECDLADLQSVGSAAQSVAARWDHVDLQFNIAGTMAAPLRRVGPGWESQFAVNHLGHFALTVLLWPLLVRAEARVIVYSSAGHHFSPVRWDDVHFEHSYDKWVAYGQAKTANALFALELDQIGRTEGVQAFSLHPGAILTPLQRHLDTDEMIELGWTDQDGNGVDPSFKSVSQGAATGLWAATAADLDGRGGLYLEDCDVATAIEPGGATAGSSGVMTYATDTDAAERLWKLSAELTHLDIPN